MLENITHTCKFCKNFDGECRLNIQFGEKAKKRHADRSCNQWELTSRIAHGNNATPVSNTYISMQETIDKEWRNLLYDIVEMMDGVRTLKDPQPKKHTTKMHQYTITAYDEKPWDEIHTTVRRPIRDGEKYATLLKNLQKHMRKEPIPKDIARRMEAVRKTKRFLRDVEEIRRIKLKCNINIIKL